jgi:hypothetical protein
VPGAYVIVSGGAKAMHIVTGWDKALDIPRTSDIPDVTTSAFKNIKPTSAGNKKTITPVELQKLDSFCIAGEYLQTFSNKRTRSGKGKDDRDDDKTTPKGTPRGSPAKKSKARK